MARRISPVVTPLNNAEQSPLEEQQPSMEGLEPIPGDTFAVRGELKAIGAVWDASEKVWRIAPEKLPTARALVEKQTLAPATALKAASADTARAPVDVNDLPDPFEDEEEGPRVVTLGRRDGATYDKRETLRAVGARWDGERRAWVIREDRAEYARAVLTADTPEAESRPRQQESPQRTPKSLSSDPAAAVAEAPAPSRDTPHRLASPTAAPTAGTTTSGANTNIRAAAVRPPAAAPSPEPRTTRPMAERIKLGGLWLNKTRDGKEYLSGRINGNVKILIFRNEYRSADNQPSHVMYLAPVEQEEAQRPAPTPQDSFFGGFAGGPSGNGAGGHEGEEEFDGGDFGDDFVAADEPPPAPAPRPAARPASAAPARPATGAPSGRTPQSGGAAPRPGAPTNRPASAPPSGRRPAQQPPAEPAGGFEEFDDPFAE